MKIKQTIGLIIAGIALAGASGQAQTTPTGTVTGTSVPQGAVAPDSTTNPKATRSQKRAMKRNRKDRPNSATSTTRQDARYRQSSSSDGTSINNSNTTNYNSNNVTTAPTGVGSNPNTPAASPVPAKPNDQPGSDPNNNAALNTSGSGSNADAGAKQAIAAAPTTTKTPAVDAGSTVRNANVGDFIASSPNYITLQNALQSAALAETLKGSGPYTVFAPSNDAFKKLPATTQAGLLDGQNREALKNLLLNHVVKGSMKSADLTRQIKSGNGQATLETLAGGTLTAKMGPNNRIMLTDEQGGTASVESAEASQENGVVYSINAILMPKAGATAFH